jgi:hypothetical protein
VLKITLKWNLKIVFWTQFYKLRHCSIGTVEEPARDATCIASFVKIDSNIQNLIRGKTHTDVDDVNNIPHELPYNVNCRLR